MSRGQRVAVIGLGGTISSEGGEGAGVVPVSGAEVLAREIAGWLPGIELLPQSLTTLPSPSLTLTTLLELRDAVAALPDDVDGVVVSQGTDTIEETAYVLDLLGAATDRPVVVTGAMRSRGAAGQDGPANLVAAVLVAASPQARGAGVLVQFADVVHAARWVTKRSTFQVDGFSSAPLGPVGLVSEGRVHVELVPRPRPVLSAPTAATAAALADLRVGVVTAGPGDDLALLPGLASAGYDGLVLAGVGGGHVAADAVEAVVAAAQTLPVVLCSRIGAGPVMLGTYGYPGGEIDLLGGGLLPGRLLSPGKARMLLLLLLAGGARGEALREQLERYAA